VLLQVPPAVHRVVIALNDETEVMTVALLLGNVNVFNEPEGPVTLKNPLDVPPLVPSRILALDTPPLDVDPKLIGDMSAPTRARRVADPLDPFGVAYTRFAAPDGAVPAGTAQVPSARRKFVVDAPQNNPATSIATALDVCGVVESPFRIPLTGPNRG
jgi:hypothetical protein